MIDEFAKDYLHSDLRDVRATMLWKIEGLAEYDVRRPLTTTGTNLLGLIKHLADTEARYFGDVFGRPFPERLPGWGDDDFELFADMWATADESRAEIVDRYKRVWDHSDATIAALDIDAPGHVPWWPRPNVKLFNVLVHVLTETNRHAGHADILREQLDGAVGTEEGGFLQQLDRAFWENHRAKIDQAAKVAGPAQY
ncbi:MAG: DinB family protein [Acidimicrobiia bacterium]